MATAATTATMPARTERSAPTFDPKQPRELTRYFRELEALFTRCKITDEQEKKSYARSYLDVDSDDLWSELPEFGNTSTYDIFKKAVLALYPGAEQERKWSIADMDKLTGERV